MSPRHCHEVSSALVRRSRENTLWNIRRRPISCWSILFFTVCILRNELMFLLQLQGINNKIARKKVISKSFCNRYKLQTQTINLCELSWFSAVVRFRFHLTLPEMPTPDVQNAEGLKLSLCRPLTPEASKKKKLHEHLRVGGGRALGPPSTFDNIDPISMIFGTYNKLPLYLQLNNFTWCLIGFRDNHSYINDVTMAAILDFQIFRFYSNLNSSTSK